MVDAIVSPFLEQLISIAFQEAKEQVCLIAGVGKEMKKLTSNLEGIQAAIVDAEQKKMKEETVRLWLYKLKDATYDMEDVLGEWNYARLKIQIEGVSQKKVCSFFPVPCSVYKQVVLQCGIATKIKEINEKLDPITKQKYMFNSNVNGIRIIEPSKQVPSISIIDESNIVGRLMEKNSLINKLICESSGEQNGLHIISLVGTGGIGKTTVAQLAYNSDTIKKHFEKRIWVCVSDSFDAFKIARAIIECLNASTFAPVEPKARMQYFGKSMTGKKFPPVLDGQLWIEDYNKISPAANLVELEALMQAIHKFIEGKKFLLVLDDVWEEDHNRWEPFSYCLKKGVRGSKILITTRKETVAHMMKSTDVISIKELTKDECWLLFKQIAFSERTTEESEKLEEIGRKIAGKCQGLPLAAKSIGNHLRSQRTVEEWRSILDSEMWKLEEFEKYLLSPLLLSYNNLPSMMIKRCFSYSAVFPKDHLIKKEELIQLWMAQGYLTGKENEDMEITGAKYFDNIASRSFFRELEKDDDGIVTRCKMHDIVRDFAQFLNKNEFFTVKVSLEEPFINSFHEKVCHSTVLLGEMDSFPISICNIKRLRSLFVYGERADYSSVSEVLPKLFAELKCLRALAIHGGSDCQNLIEEIPGEIGKLIHLAYLNLSGQGIDKLPEMLCELYNLQTLNVNQCQFLKELPQGIGKLIKLRHLLNFETRSLRYMPVGIERLTSLRTLKTFVVDGGVHSSKACRLESLKKLNLFGDCQIIGLGNVSEVGEADRLQLQNVKNLVDLHLEFNKDEERERMNEQDEVILETFQPPQSLKRLKIRHYRGSTFPPSWTRSLSNLRDLCLIDCLNCKQLPSLGQLLSLEKLIVQNLKSLHRVGDEFLGIESDEGISSSSAAIVFLKLKSLVISHMENLEDWHYEIISKGEKRITIMPRLSSLEIHYCPKLKALPDHLLQTQNLNIEESPILDSFRKTRREE